MNNRKETRMAQIPYGYRIERGRIVMDTEAAAAISRFVESYLSGLSVKESKKAAKIPLSESTLNQILKNNTYLGTDDYPPLITAEVFHSVQEERKRRTHPATTRPSDPVPVKSRFVFHAHDQDSVITEGVGAARAAELLYSMIRVSPDGRKTAMDAEISEMKSASQTTASPDGRETATAADISELNREAETIIKQHQDERRLTWQ
jgi:hypothetical protein